MKRSLLLSLCLTCLFSCREAPDKLYPLPYEELVARITNGQQPSFEKAVFKDEAGRVITVDSMMALKSSGKYIEDFFVNREGEIAEVRLRKITEKDKTLLKELGDDSRPKEVSIQDIDCSQQRKLLEQVGMRAYLVRKNGISSDFNANHENLQTVVSIIEKCGMPTLQEVDSSHMQALWEVFQYAAGQKFRKKYFYRLKKAAQQGDLDIAAVASLEDRILVADGQLQRYGTYLTHNWETDVWELYQLEAPDEVDARRATVGLGPLRDSLLRYGIDFAVPQH